MTRFPGACRIDGCERSVYVKKHQVCSAHYHSLRKSGELDVNRRMRRTHPHADENLKRWYPQGKLRCATCGRVKKVHLFYKDKKKKLKHSFDCKKCTKKRRGGTSLTPGRLRSKYGLKSKDDYAAMLAFSGGECWICGGGSTKALSIDHNHKNGHVRGLLCQPCNRLLGHFGDDLEKITVMHRYLKSDGSLVRKLLGYQPIGEIKKVA